MGTLRDGIAMKPVRFQCQSGCTRCCENKGFVYLSEKDVTRIAEFLKMPQAEFEAKHVYRTAHQRRLRIRRGMSCTFLTKEGCSIHEVKPVQCRAFPFWPELLENKREWSKLY